MKKRILIVLSLVLVAWIGYRIYRISTTRSHSPTQTTGFSYKDLDVNVVYGRPYKKGRLIFGEAKDRWWLPEGKAWTDGFRLLTGQARTTGALVPNGQYWRLGANEATEISFSKDVNFAGEPLPAGRYRMYAVPNATTWRVSLNSELAMFGYNEPDYALDVLSVEVPVASVSSTVEQFTIDFTPDSTGLNMDFMWDRTRVRIPIDIH